MCGLQFHVAVVGSMRLTLCGVCHVSEAGTKTARHRVDAPNVLTVEQPWNADPGQRLTAMVST